MKSWVAMTSKKTTVLTILFTSPVSIMNASMGEQGFGFLTNFFKAYQRRGSYVITHDATARK